jgi:hypothetical protein
MEREFLAAFDLAPDFDYAGPNRNLGLLYLQAPVVASIGSRSKARLHLHRAAERAPEYPENRLNLIEACLKWGDLNEARREMKALEALWAGAQDRFAGEPWAVSWQEWAGRLKAAKHKLDQASKPLESPRHDD